MGNDRDMAEPEPAEDVLRIRSSGTERLICAAVVVVCPVAVTSLAFLSGVPPLQGVIAAAIIEVFLLPFVMTAYRFEVRVDSHEILHREFVTRRIPLQRIKRIRVAHETRRGIGWPLEHTKIEITGKHARILVSWRRGKMAPLLRRLEERFPDKVGAAESLPDI